MKLIKREPTSSKKKAGEWKEVHEGSILQPQTFFNYL